MKAKHHFWSSLAAGGALYWATGSGAALAGSLVGGFLIDGDHVIDQLWSIYQGAPHARKDSPFDGGKGGKARGVRAWLNRYVRRRKLVRLPLVFHSYELLLALILLAALVGTPFVVGLVTGYGLHILLDFIRHHHEFRSPLFYFITYRVTQGFRRDRLIKSEYL